MVENQLVLIIWRDACFRQVVEPGAELGCGVLKGTVGIGLAEDEHWLHLEQDLNLERPDRKRHVYSIAKANIVEIVTKQFQARLRYWRKKGMEE